MLRVVTFIVIALTLVACDAGGSPARKSSSMEAPSKSASTNKLKVENLAGTWVATREICDPDSEVEPSTDLPTTSLILSGEGHYRKVEKGKEIRGSYTLVESALRKSVQLDDNADLSRYELVEGHLENGGEGEAVYPCALVLERASVATH